MARRTSTQACARHHRRIARLRSYGTRLSEIAGRFETEFPRYLRMEVEAVQTLLRKALGMLSDEAPRVDVEHVEREIEACSKRVCGIIATVTEDVTHHVE